nr:MAG TPA: hypothetical protein [Caudoviricetes sp.]
MLILYHHFELLLQHLLMKWHSCSFVFIKSR